jgi:hypothetical protein
MWNEPTAFIDQLWGAQHVLQIPNEGNANVISLAPVGISSSDRNTFQHEPVHIGTQLKSKVKLSP